ncbi:MAG: helix-turn-helix domain-containing protein [Defluviitaleaceae bacterium]|nr:helix-turn-helix domain-containing protein [Defluviitaleaceae bacterium]
MEKLYTVEDIAKMTMFTTRTIRNHLKDGLLTGRKIGGQWRFTHEDFKKFWDQGCVGENIKSEKKQEVLDFMDGIFAEYTGEIQGCSIIDIYRPIELAIKLRDELIQLTDTDDSHFKRFSYEYDESEGKARFILFGHPRYIGEAMKILCGEEVG